MHEKIPGYRPDGTIPKTVLLMQYLFFEYSYKLGYNTITSAVYHACGNRTRKNFGVSKEKQRYSVKAEFGDNGKMIIEMCG